MAVTGAQGCGKTGTFSLRGRWRANARANLRTFHRCVALAFGVAISRIETHSEMTAIIF